MRFFLIALLLSGCASLPEDKATYAACRAADVGTTLYIVNHGGKELNPLMAAALKGGPLVFIGIQIALAYWIFSGWEEMDSDERKTANAISCSAPIINTVGIVK